jgi:predicted ribosome quality control (RQC) complex YloA/Tae2 family protein
LPKKDFTSFDIHAVIHELKDTLVDARVNNIYQLDGKTLLLKLHKTNQAPLLLILEAGRRLHLTAYSLEKPNTPPAFCMTLRKYLPGAWITNVEQHEFERVVTLFFQAKTGVIQLILELFGEGNIILSDEKGAILQALVFKRMRDRNIVRKEIYQFPPSGGKNPFKVTRKELEEGLKAAGDIEVVRATVRFLGLGGIYAEELLVRAGVEKTTRCSVLTSSNVDTIFEALQSLLSAISGPKREPRIVLDENGDFVDVLPFGLNRYEAFKIQPYPTFNGALDEFYVRVTATEKAVAGVDIGPIKREAERLKRMIADQEQALRSDDSKAIRDKSIGNAIYAHFNDLQILLERFSNARNTGRDLNALAIEVLESKEKGKIAETFFVSFDGPALAINVCVDALSFCLSLRKTLYENAAEYYDRGKRAKQKSAGVFAALAESRKKLFGLEKRVGEAEALRTAAPAEAMEELSKRRVESKEWYEKFRWFISSEGFLVVAGKDTVSNEVLIKKYTEPYDVVFHAEIVGSPFVVVKTAGKEPNEQTLLEASEFAASFSRAWREGMGAADVYWVKPEQLSKSGPSGESIPHGAFAVNGKRNWLRGTPLRVAIGVVENGETRFVGGPVETVKSKTKTFIVLGPGDLEGKDLLRQVLRSLMLKLPKDQRESVGKASIESIREFVPYTKGRIVIAAS